MSKKNKHYIDILEQGKELVDFYINNPCMAANDLLGVDLAPIQRLVFQDMWFKDYVITTASRGFGKSVHKDSIIHNKNNGLVYLNEILPPIPSYLRDGEDEVISWDTEVYTSEGYRFTKKLCLEKGIKGKFIRTQNGFENRGSNHHPLLTMNSDCEFVYKSLENLVPGDRLCIQRDQQTFGNISVDIDDAYLIGLLIGDGHLVHNTSFITSDLELLNFCKDYCSSRGVHYSISKTNGDDITKTILFSNKIGLIEKYGVKRTLSYTKSVPYSIRISTRESQIAFLQGYFDTDGTVHNNNGGISCCSVSKKLMQEIQLMLLNFGIVSRLREKNTKSKFGKAYLLDMFSKDAYMFSELIGFRLKRKQSIVENYFNNKTINVNKDTIPYVKTLCRNIANDYRSNNGTRYDDPNTPSLKIYYSNCIEYTYDRLYDFVSRSKYLLSSGYTFSKDSVVSIDKLNNILKYHYYFDTVECVEDWIGDCYDFGMDMRNNNIEPNYFTNGFINHNTYLIGTLAVLSSMLKPGYRTGLLSPSFRQSKLIFAEVEKLYSQSSIFREACDKPPVRGTDSCYVKFKSVAGIAPSFIEAVPLGNDGGKIRGSRFYLIVVDELAQVPDSILDLVIRPFGAASMAPMERVRRLEQQQKLIELGIATSEDFEKETVNKMIMTSSGYYKFNHMWRRMKDHWKQMNEAEKKGVDCPYAVWQIPYWDLPTGFLDMNNINEAKRVMSSTEFKMEYEAAMVSDSEGFFKASLLDSCTINSGFYIETRGNKGGQYIIGVDPNQGGAASAGIVIIRVGAINKIANVLELKKQTTQEMTETIQDICSDYNVIRIFMDKGGGGKAIADLLEAGHNGYEPIIDRTNEDHRHMQGRHILELVAFNPAWIADANFTTKSMLENKSLLFPEIPVSTTVDLESKQYENINTLKSQMLNIIVTQTSTGMLHFDTPAKGQNKDLYSALILAAHGARCVEKELDQDQEPVLYNLSGMVRLRNAPSNSFREVQSIGNISKIANNASALLKKRLK